MSKMASCQKMDVSRLLFDLKRCSELMSRFTGWLEADAIATCITDGLIEQFSCAFARVWLVEPDRKSLRLVASSGLYKRLDGSFSRVPMGSFKVGRIAQHCIPFLSNALPDETWVKDRVWAIENNIQGFAGLPLMAEGQAIGVLAVFSHAPMAPEFLEVLQMLSLSVAGALAGALNHESIIRARVGLSNVAQDGGSTLSEQLATILGGHKLSLLGMEKTLSPAIAQLLVEVASGLSCLACRYCRLVYEADTVAFEAMLATADGDPLMSVSGCWAGGAFEAIAIKAQQLGGTLQTQADTAQTVMEVRVQLPQRLPDSFLDSFSDSSSASSFNNLLAGEGLDGLSDIAALPLSSPLSEREQEVIGLLSQGFRDRDISEQLFISERTVKFHAKNMMAKLGVKTRVQAIFEATKQGWL